MHREARQPHASDRRNGSGEQLIPRGPHKLLWHERAKELKSELRRELDRDRLRALHLIEPRRHFLIAARQILLALICAGICWHFEDPRIWIPAAALQGLTLFNFSVLLHEQVHGLIFPHGAAPRRNRILGYCYASACGLSVSQFTRWHLDHHRYLGDAEADPKRHRLSPKRRARWLKLLYATPALFFIYFRAAGREVASYPPELRRRIAKERGLVVALHLAIALALVSFGGWGLAARVHLLPIFVGFPPAFALNRLGQHYDIDPSDPRRWTTRVDGNVFWQLAFLNSNHHLEHHWFPTLPFYNLPAANRELRPFFGKHQIPNRGYGQLLWGWIALNRRPHSRWERRLTQGTGSDDRA